MEQKNLQEKQLRMMQIQTIVMVCILVLIVAVGAFLAVQLADLGHCLTLVEQQLQALDLDEVNSAVTAMTGAAENLKTLDLEALNGLVSTLQEIAADLQRVTRFFGG